MSPKLKRSITWLCCGVGFAATLLTRGPGRVEARPLYQKVWREVYPDKDVSNAKCAICHVGEKKTTRNEYGEAVKEALGTTNVKNEDAIKEALKKAEGKLPGKKP
ncbi:MAG: hypothetical protein JWP89_1014 [Schlesneria sp.]|nr:hypothetical protein [Schlesneria sp.]